MSERQQSLGEELANSLTHGAGLLASVAALPLLVLTAVGRRDPWQLVAKCTLGFRFPRLSTVFYVAMGWLIVVALPPLLASVSPAGIGWLVAGGACYTAGVPFYASDTRLRFGHSIWHLFVVVGSVCHFFAVLGHAARGPG